MAVGQAMIPPYEERRPITWSLIPQVMAYWVPFYLMAYLVRRTNTHLCRLCLLPVVMSTTAYCNYWFKVEDPKLSTAEMGRTFLALVVLAKAIDYAFAKRGRFKVGERALPRIGEPRLDSGDGHPKASARWNYLLPRWFRDASDIIFAMRGIGWDFGKGVYVPQEPRQLVPRPFMKATFLSLLWNYFIIDLLNSLFKLIPRVGTPTGGSIFLPELSPLPRYALSSAIHLASGFIIQYGMDVCNDIATLFGVGLLGQSPADWPPIQDKAWLATSLHEYWGKRWHQTLRQIFLIYGGYVGEWLAGPPGMVLGSFFASGMYHEVGMHMSDHRVTIFFLLQGVGIILEGIWRRATGGHVGGFPGWLWTAFFVLVLGQPCTDAWAIRGLIGGLIIPYPLSLSRLVLFPAVRSLLELARRSPL